MLKHRLTCHKNYFPVYGNKKQTIYIYTYQPNANTLRISYNQDLRQMWADVLIASLYLQAAATTWVLYKKLITVKCWKYHISHNYSTVRLVYFLYWNSYIPWSNKAVVTVTTEMLITGLFGYAEFYIHLIHTSWILCGYSA